MKKFLLLFSLISNICLSQEPVFNFEKNKAYKIIMKGANDFLKADNFARQTEKMQVAIFSYVDPKTSTGYFIVENLDRVQEIEKLINKEVGLSFLSTEEITLDGDFFLDVYMKRGGYEKSEFSKNKPKEIIMGPWGNLTSSLYRQALTVWEKAYSKTYKDKKEGFPEHYPVFINSGNPEADNNKFEKAKQEWLKNYPEESR